MANIITSIRYDPNSFLHISQFLEVVKFDPATGFTAADLNSLEEDGVVS